jgi:lipid II isoglutaminyl synthase (glutamine-hydrolysing)
MNGRTVVAVTVYPLAGIACGDDANGVALARRADRRGIPFAHHVVQEDEVVPQADLYLLGGRGTAQLPRLTSRLADGGHFLSCVGDGAAVLAVDAGMDALGHGVQGETTARVPGLGLLDVTSVPGSLRDGAAVTEPVPDLALPQLTGWLQTDLALSPGPSYRPFAWLEVGEGDVGRADGVVSGHLLGTRLHGPLAAVNPEVADLLLAWATDQDPRQLPVLDDDLAREARRRRIEADVTAARRAAEAVSSRAMRLGARLVRGRSRPTAR